MIYLDYAATTPLDPAVNDYMHEIAAKNFGNPSSLHFSGQRSKVILENARGIIAKSISANRNEIVFSSGGTEANNHAILGAAFALREQGRHLITSKIEHPSVLGSFQYLEQHGFIVDYLDVDRRGCPDLNKLHQLLTDKTILVSIMMVNNETGTILPIREIASILKPWDILFHTDAVQAFGKLPVSVQDLGIDMLSLSAHKIYGPKGCGALYIKNKRNLINLLHGGSQEENRRPGTENFVSVAGFAKAVESVPDLLSHSSNLQSLRHLFENQLNLLVPGVIINGGENERVCSHSNIYFPNEAGLSLLIKLDRMGVAVSTGSACSSGSSKPSHVLQAMGLSDEQIKNSIRFSIGKYTVKADILKTLDILKEVMQSSDRLAVFC